MRILALLAFAGLVVGQTKWPVVIDSGSASDSNFVGGQVTTIQNPPANVSDITARYGNFSYSIPCANIPYVVTFAWVEQTVGGPGQRQFQVAINNQIIFDKLDLFATAGYMAPFTRSVIVMGSGNLLNIVFTTEIRNAIVSSISVVPLFMLFGTNLDGSVIGIKFTIGDQKFFIHRIYHNGIFG